MGEPQSSRPQEVQQRALAQQFCPARAMPSASWLTSSMSWLTYSIGSASSRARCCRQAEHCWLAAWSRLASGSSSNSSSVADSAGRDRWPPAGAGRRTARPVVIQQFPPVPASAPLVACSCRCWRGSGGWRSARFCFTSRCGNRRNPGTRMPRRNHGTNRSGDSQSSP